MKLKDIYYIKDIDYHIAMDIVKKYHYLHRIAPCSFSFGLFEKDTDELIGVICYGTPPSAPLRMGICGKEEKNNVIELTRLWIKDNSYKNAESFLIGNTIKKVDKEIIVSYADQSEGHIGYVYQATNFIYTGLSAKRKNFKINNSLDKKHNITLNDKYSVKELREIYGENFIYVDRPRKHRYIYFNTTRKRKKELLKKLKYNVLPYPKPMEIMIEKEDCILSEV